MKYILYLLLALSLMIGGCKKFLTTEPSNFVKPDANFATEYQLKEALAGVYDVLGYNRQQLYANYLYGYLNACTDISFFARASHSVGTEVYNFDYTDSKVNGTWQALYTGIERANNLISKINVSKSIDSTERNAILGETLFLRGYYYFMLVSYFGDVPLRLKPTTETGADNVDIPRTPSKEVYDQILKDMTTALEKVYPATHFQDASRINKGVVEGILARVCLTMAGHPLNDTKMYAKAAQYADAVINSNVHSLNPSYKQVFINELQGKYDEQHRGVLWEAQFYGNNTQSYNEEGRIGNVNGIQYNHPSTNADTGFSYGFINATAKLYNLYENGDLRRDWSIAPYKYNKSDRVPNGPLLYDRNMGKWRRSFEEPAPKNKNFNGTNFPILRYSDVLLMYAEAENQLNDGPTSLAYEAINKVRRRGYGLPVDQSNTTSDLPNNLSKEDFQKTIEDERARELCFECLRRPDLIRWGIWTETMQDAAQKMHNDLDGNTGWKYASLGASNAASAPRYLLFPIPSSETIVNKAIVQNPGY